MSMDEVKSAILGMSPLKAPRPDGMHALFFQENWDVIRQTMFSLVKGAFHDGQFPTMLSKTYISLMSKVEHPEVVSHLRPIALSNVVYKVITKCLVNRF